MKITQEKVNDFQIFYLDGRLDTTNYSETEKILLGQTQHHPKIVIECSKLTYISSSGLRVFLIALKAIQKQNGEIRLANLTNPIFEIFKTAGFSGLFSIFSSLEEAIM